MSDKKIKFLDSYMSVKKFEELKKIASLQGFNSVSDYFLSLCPKVPDGEPPKRGRKSIYSINKLKSVLKVKRGVIYNGDSLNWLHDEKNSQSVNLIMTSPPFGLLREKAYGNETASSYCDWFRPFIEGFSKVLKDDGSLVIDIAGTWISRKPVRSLYHFDLLQMICREYGYYLCQEHYWWNPSKLPSPAQWVTIDRVRVKDAVNCIWWLSRVPNPKASNKNVLVPYSDGMKRLIKNGYKSGLRPSGHDISDKFQVDNGGSIPPNLLAIANTESNGAYWKYCKEHNLKIHPARFPNALPEYFIKLLTDEGDLVLDPFGGSSVTGYVANGLNRKWVSIELDADYAWGGVGRLMSPSPYKSTSSRYEIFSPCHDGDS